MFEFEHPWRGLPLAPSWRRPNVLLHITLLFLITFLTGCASHRPIAPGDENLLRNGSLTELEDDVPAGWRAIGRGERAFFFAERGIAGIQVDAPDRGMIRSWTQRLERVTPGEHLVIRGWMRSRQVVAANVIVQCFDQGDELLRVPLKSSGDLTGTQDWHRYGRAFEVPDGTSLLIVRCALYGSGAVSFAGLELHHAGDDVELPTDRGVAMPPPEVQDLTWSDLADDEPDMTTLRVVQVEGAYVFKPTRAERSNEELGREAWQRISVPPSYGRQVPLSLSLRTVPAGRVLSYSLLDEEGNASVLVELEPSPSDTLIFLYWLQHVLMVDDAVPVESPTLALDVDAEWRRGSLAIQADDKELRHAAHELAPSDAPVADVARALEGYKRRMIEFKPWGNQDALSTWERGYGVCTGHANLLAAFLRSRDIPARLVSVIPVDGRTQEHFIVELQDVDGGWTRFETTGRGITAYPFSENVDVALRVIRRGDERAHGVPRHWECSEGTDCWPMGAAFGYGCYHRSRTRALIPASPATAAEALTTARELWSQVGASAVAGAEPLVADLRGGEPWGSILAAMEPEADGDSAW